VFGLSFPVSVSLQLETRNVRYATFFVSLSLILSSRLSALPAGLRGKDVKQEEKNRTGRQVSAPFLDRVGILVEERWTKPLLEQKAFTRTSGRDHSHRSV
jgi:hypothetical protein